MLISQALLALLFQKMHLEMLYMPPLKGDFLRANHKSHEQHGPQLRDGGPSIWSDTCRPTRSVTIITGTPRGTAAYPAVDQTCWAASTWCSWCSIVRCTWARVHWCIAGRFRYILANSTVYTFEGAAQLVTSRVVVCDFPKNCTKEECHNPQELHGDQSFLLKFLSLLLSLAEAPKCLSQIFNKKISFPGIQVSQVSFKSRCLA